MASVTINQADIAKVQALLGDLKDKYKSVMTTSINKTLATAKTQATARIANEINLKSSRIKEDFSIKKANFGDISGSLKATGKPVGLVNFGANQTQKGVSVKVLKSGSRSVVKHAFIAARGSKEHVYWRSTPRSQIPAAKRYLPGKRHSAPWAKMGKDIRLPVERLTGPRIEDIYAKPKVLGPVTIQAQHVYLLNVENKIDEILRRHRG
jgi:hypothetical protein